MDETKTIHVMNVPGEDNDLQLLLIHEICHAVAAGSHAKRWRERMAKAAQKAKQMRLNKFAKMIYKEVQVYLGSYL